MEQCAASISRCASLQPAANEQESSWSVCRLQNKFNTEAQCAVDQAIALTTYPVPNSAMQACVVPELNFCNFVRDISAALAPLCKPALRIACVKGFLKVPQHSLLPITKVCGPRRTVLQAPLHRQQCSYLHPVGMRKTQTDTCNPS